MKIKTQKITETALMLALLVCIQLVTKAFGQLVTGSCVNLVLGITAIICGIYGGIIVALLSPIFAFILGIGPAFPQIVIGISFANAVFVTIICLGIKLAKDKKVLRMAIVLVAAVMKFLAIYLSVVVIILPLLNLPAQKVAVISVSFSWPQLITATIGGILSFIISIPLEKALKKRMQ